MKSPASVRARVRVAVICGLVLALLAAGFAFRMRTTLRDASGDVETTAFDLGVLLTIGAFVCGIAVALVASGLAIAPVDALTGVARAMRRDLGIRSRLRGEDELGQLGEALDQLAAWVASEKQGLEDDRNRLVAILESMAEGVLVTAASGEVVLANAALREMLLVDPRIVGRKPLEAIPVDGLEEILARAETNDASGELELEGMRPRRVFVRASAIKTADPSARAGVVAVFNDVTELRRLENVRRDFVANVSHELRTPIAAISSAAETLQHGALSDPKAASEFVDIVARHATRLQRLVEDLLDLSRIEAREWRFELVPLDPSEAIDATIDALALAASQRSAVIERRVHAGVGRVRADRRALELVLVNLVDNAIKYGGPHPEVSVSAEREGAFVRIVVRDRGPGIEARHRGRIFERFYRVDPGRSRAVGGTGLGLSIVKNLVEAMGGTVTVESAVGAGTAFNVTLPSAERLDDGETSAQRDEP